MCGAGPRPIPQVAVDPQGNATAVSWRVGDIGRHITFNPTAATSEEAATAVTVQQSHRNRHHRGCTATEVPSLGVAVYVTATLAKSR